MRPLPRSATNSCWVRGSNANPPSEATPWAAESMVENRVTSPVTPSIRQIEPGPPPWSGGPNWPGTNWAPLAPVWMRLMTPLWSGT